MKKRMGQMGLWAGAVLLLWVVVRTVPLAAVRERLGALRLWQLVVLLVLNGLVLMMLNGRWWLILRGLGHNLPFWPLLGHRLAAFGVSYFTPGPQFGGEPVQVLLVERIHGVPRTAAIAAVSLDKTVELLLNFGFLAVGVLALLRTGLFGAALGSGTAVWVFLLLLPPLLYLWLIWRGKRPFAGLLSWLQSKVHVSWLAGVAAAAAHSEAHMNDLCQQNPQALIAAFLVSLFGWGLLIVEFYSMASFLGLSLTIYQLIGLLAAARIAFLLPLPGGLGTLEASQVWALGLLGFNPAAGIGLSLLIRARDVSLGLLGLWWGSRLLRMEWIRP